MSKNIENDNLIQVQQDLTKNISAKNKVLSNSKLVDYKQQFIEFIVKTGALKFGEFKLKSGRISPYFFNAGNFADGESFSKLTNYYAEAVYANVSMNNTVLYGPAYKGIPLMIGTATKLFDKYGIRYPVAYNRKEAKDHGEGGLIVGTELTPKHNIVVIDDVITAGTAISETKEILATSGSAKLKKVIITLDRCEVKNEGDTKTAIQAISEEHGIQIIPIVTIYEILDYLYNREIDGQVYISMTEKQAILDYLQRYGAHNGS